MNDTISRQAAIDAFKKACTIDEVDRNGIKHGEIRTALTFEGIMKVLNNLPSAQPVDKDIDVPVKDCISRQAVINTVRTIILGFFSDEDGAMTDTEKKLLRVNKSVCNGVRALPSVQPEPHWIPCSERLPFAEYGESDKVLATCGYLNVEDTSVRWIRELYFNGGNWCYPTGETYDQKVYAWMPLPNCYQGDEK